MRRPVTALIVLLALSGCGDSGDDDSPAAPGAPDLTGTFTANVEGTTGGAPFTDMATVALRQEQAVLSGTFGTFGATGGAISGTVSGSMVTFTMSLGFPCQGVYQGTATVESGGDRLVGSYSGSAPCAGNVSASFTATRTLREPPDDCRGTATLALGVQGSGTLGPDDCLRPDGRYGERHQFVVGAATAVRVSVGSGGFDALLELEDAQGMVLAGDDDFGPGSDAQLDVNLPAGTYHVAATSYQPLQSGPYRVEVRPSFEPCLTLELIRPSESRTGSIEQDDCEGVVDFWGLHLDVARTLTITMRSTTIDSFVGLIDRYGDDLGADDDGGGGLDARLQVSVEPGDYVIVALSLTGTPGPYTLAVQ